MSKTQTGAFFNDEWNEENRVDIIRARQQHQAAINAANAPKLLMELEQNQPDEECDYGLEEILEHDEFDEDFESREEMD